MRIILFFILSLFIFVSCLRDNSILDIGHGIDDRLINDWVQISYSTSPGSPTTYIKGIRILPTGEVQSLSVETSTGKLKSYFPPKKESFSVIKAKNNYIEFEQRILNPPITRLCFGRYSINDTVLNIEKDPESQYISISGNFFRASEGDKITEPIISEMKVQINDELVENHKIWSYPSAYCTENVPYDSIKFQIKSNLNNSWDLEINLKNFTGTGKYNLDSTTNVYVRYSRNLGCLIEEYSTSALDSGFIEINEFDVQETVCSGTFNFSIINQEISEEKIIFSNGEFRIPLY